MRNSQMRRDPRTASLVARRLRRMASATPVFVAAMAIVMTSACRDITRLQQSNPGQLGPEVFSPENADLIVNSSRGDFECAFNEYVVASGLFVDELANAIAFSSNFNLDRRTLTADEPYGTADCTAQQNAGVYTTLSVARASNDTAVGHLEGWTDEQVPNRSQLIGVASAYAGYSLVLLGESMCSAAINLGPELTPAQLFAEAQTRFDTAVAAATRASDAQTLNFALLGRARTELDLGNSAAAATDAALIPPGFVVEIDHDATATIRQNLVWIHTQHSLFSSVDTSIQHRYATSHDPRIAVTSTGELGPDGFTLVVFPNKDGTVTSPQAIAKYSEAQLIIAENDANTGQLSQAVTIINAVRTAGGWTDTFAPSPLTQATVMAGIVEERRRELFVEGHRLGDIRRLGLPISPPAGAPYVSGGTYADLSCFPLPNVEKINNPNIGG
jgi:starch-binding outer membrane protein, SusD/RagB family